MTLWPRRKALVLRDSSHHRIYIKAEVRGSEYGNKFMRIMAISDLHGNLEGLDPSGAAVVVLLKRSMFRFGNY